MSHSCFHTIRYFKTMNPTWYTLYAMPLPKTARGVFLFMIPFRYTIWLCRLNFIFVLAYAFLSIYEDMFIYSYTIWHNTWWNCPFGNPTTIRTKTHSTQPCPRSTPKSSLFSIHLIHLSKTACIATIFLLYYIYR